MEYKKELFESYKNEFLKEETKNGKEAALRHMRNLFYRKLKPAYDAMQFKKGDPYDFARVVSERDRSVGLEVSVKVASPKKIIYIFYTDPFPFEELKKKATHREFDDCYMAFKLEYLLGSDWHYKTTKHVWDGDRYTEHVIEKG